jgi:hypothetical protein
MNYVGTAKYNSQYSNLRDKNGLVFAIYKTKKLYLYYLNWGFSSTHCR